MNTEVITAIISGAVTLLVSLGTWHVSMRQHRVKTQASMIEAMDDVKDTMTANISDIQSHLSIIDLKIETLSDRVDKHNDLIDRMYAVEKASELNGQEIEHLKEKLA